MFFDQLHELTQLKAQIAKQEAALADQRLAELASLPEEFGFPTLKAFIKALKQHAGAKPKAKGKAAKVAKVKKPGRRKQRGKVTDEVRAAVKAGIEAGKKGVELSRELGLSTTSVNLIKKSLGLVKSRGVSPAAEAPAEPTAQA